MSEILSNIVVEQTSINFSPNNNNLNVTPEAIQLNIFTGASPGAGQSSNGELLYNNVNLIDGVPNTSFASGNLTLGNVANIKITGGTNGYVLQTDGTGNLDWTAQTGNGGGNGVPGGANTQIQYNDSGAFGGNSGFTFNEVSGNVAIPGNLNVVGNIVGLVANANYANFAGTVLTNAQPNITSVGTLTSLSVTGNISAGNVSATTFTGALSGAATTAGTVTTNAQPNITTVGTLNGLSVSGNGISATQIRTTATKVALGLDAGLSNQGNNAVSVGADSGYINQGANTVAVGFRAGYDTQGANSIAIGAFAGNFLQSSNTIVLNATGAALNTSGTDSLYVKPIRNATSNNFVFYNDTSGEVTYNANIGTLPSLNVTGNANVGNLNVTGNTTLASTFVKPIQESVTIVGTAPGANYTYNLIDQAVVYNTANTNANLTLNFRGNSTTTADSFISNNNSIVATYLMTTGVTAYGISAVNIDGNARAIKWAGNTVPNTYQNTIMSYTFNLIKTGSNTYTVMGSATRYG